MRNFLRGTLDFVFPNSTADIPNESCSNVVKPLRQPDHDSTSKSAFEVLLNNASRRSQNDISSLEMSMSSGADARRILPIDENSSQAQYPHDSIKPIRKRRKLDGDDLSALDMPQSDLRNTTLSIAPLLDDTQDPAESVNPPRKLRQLKLPGQPPSPKYSTGTKSKRGKSPKHVIAICVYAARRDSIKIGAEIDSILTAPSKQNATLPRDMVVKGTCTKNQPAHPFFGTRNKLRKINTIKPSLAAPSHPNNQSAVTPGKIRAQMATLRAERQHDHQSPLRGIGTKSKTLGLPTPWPARNELHVRGSTPEVRPSTRHHHYSARKMKNRAPMVARDNVLTSTKAHLYDDNIELLRPDGFSDPPPTLRLPRRAILTGDDIKTYVSHVKHPQSITHPACRAVYDDISCNMTPWDHGRSEMRHWPAKYAPQTIAAVLQPGNEPQLLADWLRSLVTSSVGKSRDVATRTLPNDTEPKKKRRKKQADLEGFVVSSDEEDLGELEELPPLVSGTDDRKHSATRQITMVRSYRSGVLSRVANVVVISGGHGCGKTAMVYAVAKELGFEIFEINSGTRRSGKDILERVGDMAGNHLVQHHDKIGSKRTDTDAHADADADTETDALAATKSFEEEVASGRQGTMTSFFQKKPKSTATTTLPIKRQLTENKVEEVPTKIRQVRRQKQSLILLEEADVLFEEDKTFWPTVMSLAVGSKRPVIITCSNESMLPLQALTLHAIIRLSAPATDLAAEYMLYIAACEGHLLDSQALVTLYESKGRDLRASLTNLQFWCQMGVGDPRGGLGWIFQRWPSGTDVDALGRPLRVTSQGAFLEGMGCLSERPQSENTIRDAEQHMALEYWNNWSVDPRDTVFAEAEEQGGLDYQGMAAKSHPRARLESLRRLTALDRLLSDLDMIAPVGLPTCNRPTNRYTTVAKRHRSRLDPTCPDLQDKARLDYTEGLRLLQAEEVVDYAELGLNICATASVMTSAMNGLDLYNAKDAQTLRHRTHWKATGLPPVLSRADFSLAFDPIADAAPLPLSSGLAYGSFDGPFRDITVDVAPYVRSIVRFDLALEEQRGRLSSALESASASSSQGNKKSRTTRAARSALEGGQRQLTRRERWFTPQLNLRAVLHTGGDEWAEAGSPTYV